MLLSEAIAKMQAMLETEGDHTLVTEVGCDYHDVRDIESNAEAGWAYILTEK